MWFDWLVEAVQRQAFAPTGGPVGVAADRSLEPFAIVDDAGYRLVVYPALAEMMGVREAKWYRQYPPKLDVALRDKLERGVGMPEPAADGDALYFTERWLAAGERCFVMGRVEGPEPQHGPEVYAVIREGGARDFLISAGVPDEAQASLRRQMVNSALGALALIVLAVMALALA